MEYNNNNYNKYIMKNDFSVIINDIPLYNKIDSILCQIIKYFPQVIPAVQYTNNTNIV